MYYNDNILVGKTSDKKELSILPSMANRHGLITGASGSGKTITLKVMAESFSDAGVPVFLADVKGDLAGTAYPGEMSDKIKERVDKLGLEGFEPKAFPVRFWDLYGEAGHHLRATIEAIGSDVLAIILGLNEVQEGCLAVAFKVAKEQGQPLNTTTDLRKALEYLAENRTEISAKYGNVTTQSIGAIQRNLLILENQGADRFFGQPMLNINDFFQVENGRGVINILDSVKLFESPDLYAAFLLWILNELFSKSPEVGDLDKPRLVFFFDEAHLLFNNMPTYRLKRITQIVKLIRSRGIGLYFISQAPTDIPDEILAQLGNRVQHTLRAYTSADQKTVKAAAAAFRVNSAFDTETAIRELGTGEALISFQNAKGAPEIVEYATILPPQSRMGVIDNAEREAIINASPLHGKYSAAPNSATDTQNRKEIKASDPNQAQADALAKYKEQYGNGPLKKEGKTMPKTEAKTTKKSTTKKENTFIKAIKRFFLNVASAFGRKIGAGSLFKKTKRK